MSSIKCGIVGLPNVGKSTLFNALLKKQQAYVANFPFATIEPNVGIVPVPDSRLEKLSEVVKLSENMNSLPPIVNATVEFVDIAGLIAGAHKGEGLGNKFLTHIREVDAICHVVRVFSDGDIVKEGSVDPKGDLETIETELALADLQTLEKQKEPKLTAPKEEKQRWEVISKILPFISDGVAARNASLDEEEFKIAKMLGLLTLKPALIVLNVAESDLATSLDIEKKFAAEFNVNEDQVITICAKTESQLAELPIEDQNDYLASLGIEKSGLERLIQKAFKTLGLATFLTAGAKEVRAWTIKDGIKAPEAAGVIHTDFEKKFIKADVVSFDDFVDLGGWKPSRENGKVRSEGKEYVVKEGDVIEFKIGT